MIQPTFLIEQEDATASYAKLIIEPLDKGYGHTLGNALRRVMLSSLPGTAITSVKVQGVNHQFTTLAGLSEDLVELILNIKQLRIKSSVEGPVTLRINAKGKTEISGKDVEAESGVEVINPELHLATMTKGKTLEVEMIAEMGYGYSMANERKSDIVGMIPVDAMYSPVVKVAYTVETTRVGRRTDFDKLVMQVWTDASIAPKAALEEAARVLVMQFQQVYNPVAVTTTDEQSETSSTSSSSAMKLTVEELDLPTRIANALRKGGYKTVEDLLNAPKAEVARVKNLGEKSVVVVEEALNKKGFSLKD